MDRENELVRNLDKMHTTELGIERIGRNLSLNAEDVVEWCNESEMVRMIIVLVDDKYSHQVKIGQLQDW